MSGKKFLLGQAVITRLDDKLNGEKKMLPLIFFSSSSFPVLSYLCVFSFCLPLYSRERSMYIPFSVVCISRLLALQSNITPFFSIIRKLSTRHGQANEGFRYRQSRGTF